LFEKEFHDSFVLANNRFVTLNIIDGLSLIVVDIRAMLCRLKSVQLMSSPLKSLLFLSPSRLANTFIDEEYIRENTKSLDSDSTASPLTDKKQVQPSMSFAKMFRQSKFVQLGGLKGRLLSGRIIDIVDDDLYVDYGGKFHAVVQRPQTKQRDQYTMGSVVSIRLQSWEMAARFLGASRHISLLESDAQLVGVLKRVDRTNRSRDKDIDLRYRPGDGQAPISAKREVL
jgi:small subunit ribosomal protein S28